MSAQDWLELGLRALAEKGPSGLTIEALCRRAQRTKGSFYAHFPDAATFVRRLAAHWRAQHTERLLERARADADRRAVLDRLALGLDLDVEREMRRLAAGNAEAAEALREADRERLAFLAEEHRRGGSSPADARALALLEYALFLAYLQNPPADREHFADAYERFLRTVERASARDRSESEEDPLSSAASGRAPRSDRRRR